MQRQIRHFSFSKSIIWIICSTLIAVPSPSAFGMGNTSDSPLSSFGLTEQKFEDEAKEFLGIPYRKGGTSKRGLDCSGFARMIYDRLFGIDLPHNSIGQFSSSELQKITTTADLQPGDLIFFGNTSKKKRRINHVGVYLSDGQFIHASSSQGVTVSSLDDRYWKKRFVGSKRHLALNSNGDDDQIRFESSIEIPVQQNGTLTGYTRDDFRSQSSSFLQVDFNTFTDDSFDVRDMDHSPLNFYEVGYDHALADGFNMNLSAIRETFDTATVWQQGFDLSTRNMSYRLDDYASYDTAVRQGLKLASNFQPSDWLIITPSITFFDYSLEAPDFLDGPKRTLGLNTLLAPANNHWSLAMLLQYSDRDHLTGTAAADNMLSSLNMGVKLGINLTDNMQFSIIGKHDKRMAALGMPEDSTLQTSNSNVFLTFDFSL